MRRSITGLLTMLGMAASAVASEIPKQPNVVIIFCDDLGYGDLGCYGNPTIRTPNLDRMAASGMKLTQFYASSSVCTPSRAGLLTGRLPQRSGMWGNRRVLFPDSVGGLPAEEITIAEKMREAGYATGCVGKWHLGHLPQYLPTEHGFDRYYGIPYSNDMDRVAGAPANILREPTIEAFNVPLIESMPGAAPREIERPADQNTITKRYTEQSIDFIRQNREQPFFLYLAHSMPHVPLFRSEEFIDRSLRGRFGDVIEELDWSVGQILDTLEELEIAERTLVFFTSDNGPWLIFDTHGGSAGPLRDGKGSTWDGGMREPAIAWWPGTIPAGVTNTSLSSTLDLLPTCCRLAGVLAPADRTLDGFDLTDHWLAAAPNPRQWFFYYRGDRLMAARDARFKTHLIIQDGYGPGARTAQVLEEPLLYDLGVDPGEHWDIREANPQALDHLRQAIAEHQATITIADSQLDRKK